VEEYDTVLTVAGHQLLEYCGGDLELVVRFKQGHNSFVRKCVYTVQHSIPFASQTLCLHNAVTKLWSLIILKLALAVSPATVMYLVILLRLLIRSVSNRLFVSTLHAYFCWSVFHFTADSDRHVCTGL
jgi:hypothetical protein